MKSSSLGSSEMENVKAEEAVIPEAPEMGVSEPVAQFSDVGQESPQDKIELGTDGSNDFQDYLKSLRANPAVIEDFEAGPKSSPGNRKTISIAESDQTHHSIAGQRCADTYAAKERYDILGSLWISPSAAELKLLSSSEIQTRISSLVRGDKEAAVNQVKRFDTVFRHTLLATQHEIIELEEAMSQGTHVPTGILRERLTEYASLIKSYKELLAMKQPGQKESRAFGRLLARELHEPRYWYAVDALDLIDLEVHVERGTHDIVRKFLQQKLPVKFLDRTGKERRELDDIEAKKELPSGGMAKIIEAYRRHGRYISPSVDNFARILFALLGGIFLLAPMVAMAYITSTKYLLITTVLFVLFFAIILALSSKASNQELVAATAAYAAVLVVFFGNNIGPKSGFS